ncbi:MAG: hypothetical protein L0H41_15705 [Microlunatus sp.]|nr:hypothetical protein [Microlunatus sp.]
MSEPVRAQTSDHAVVSDDPSAARIVHYTSGQIQREHHFVFVKSYD